MLLKCKVITLCGLWIVNNMYLKVALLQNERIIQVFRPYFFVLLVLYQACFLLLLLVCKLCLAFKENPLVAQFASNPLQVVYLFSNLKNYNLSKIKKNHCFLGGKAYVSHE